MSLPLIGAGPSVDAVGGGGGFSIPASAQVWAQVAGHAFTDAGITPATTAGDVIQQINEQSGLNNHAATPTSTERGTYQVVSGKPCIRLDGVDNRIYSGPGIAVKDANGQSWSAISFTMANLTATSQYLINIFQSSGGFMAESWMRAHSDGIPDLVSFSNTDVGIDAPGPAITAGTPIVLFGQVIFDGASSGSVELWAKIGGGAITSGGNVAFTTARQVGTAYVVVGADANNTQNAAADVFGWAVGQGVLGSTVRDGVINELASYHP